MIDTKKIIQEIRAVYPQPKAFLIAFFETIEKLVPYDFDTLIDAFWDLAEDIDNNYTLEDALEYLVCVCEECDL